MEEKKEVTIQEIQSKLLEILLYFQKFCQENGLGFVLAGGTCLGAVRHKGFIPWDDDVDIAMPKNDYYRLVELVNNGERICDHIDLDACGVQNCIPY